MAGDYIQNDDGDQASESAAGEGMEGGEQSERSDTEMGETTLVPKSMFPSDKQPEPGSICSFKVVALHDNEAEIVYVPHEEEEKAEGDGGDNETPEGAFDQRFAGKE